MPDHVSPPAQEKERSVSAHFLLLNLVRAPVSSSSHFRGNTLLLLCFFFFFLLLLPCRTKGRGEKENFERGERRKKYGGRETPLSDPWPPAPGYILHTRCRHIYLFYLRRSRQIREKKALFFFFFFFLLGGQFFSLPCIVFWGVKRQKLCPKRGVKSQKLLSKILFSTPQISESITFLFGEAYFPVPKKKSKEEKPGSTFPPLSLFYPKAALGGRGGNAGEVEVLLLMLLKIRFRPTPTPTQTAAYSSRMKAGQKRW